MAPGCRNYPRLGIVLLSYIGKNELATHRRRQRLAKRGHRSTLGGDTASQGFRANNRHLTACFIA
jgi:hypothetical protein